MTTMWSIPPSAMRPYDAAEVSDLSKPDPKSGTSHRFGMERVLELGGGDLDIVEVDAELSRLISSIEGEAGPAYKCSPGDAFGRWDFNACAFAEVAKRAGRSPMVLVGKYLVQREYGLAEELGLDAGKLGMFLAALQANYGTLIRTITTSTPWMCY